VVGLASVKQQVKSVAATVAAASRRAAAGFTTERPMRHFVFAGPSGTGKTTVVPIIANIFYSFGLLDLPVAIVSQPADLIGDYPGASAAKTNRLVDSALGGVLSIDEAYRLVNRDEARSDGFGTEAVQTLARRAEDDRESLIIILAGYENQMKAFLTSYPRLASQFTTIEFPSYSPPELLAMAESLLGRRSDVLTHDSMLTLRRVLDVAGHRPLIDELGNGRFIRNLLDKAGQARDLRVMTSTALPQLEDLVTIQAPDLQRAFNELISGCDDGGRLTRDRK
jgi:SpoVK/Ycf46/Vps4 family AAA+-type ATPase